MRRWPAPPRGSPSERSTISAQRRLVQAQMQDRVVQFARQRERPELARRRHGCPQHRAAARRSGPSTVMVRAPLRRDRAPRAHADRPLHHRRSCVAAASARCPWHPPGGRTARPAPARARAASLSHAEGGTNSSTSRHSIARRAAHAFLGGAEHVGAGRAAPCACRSAASARRCPAAPPAAAAPASATPERRSSISMMWSAAIASS